jgi:hypothetical protein
MEDPTERWNSKTGEPYSWHATSDRALTKSEFAELVRLRKDNDS